MKKPENEKEKIAFKESFLKLDIVQQFDKVVSIAKELVDRISPYDKNEIYVERQSILSGDWYLWTVVAKAKPGTKNDTYAAWTLNLTDFGLHSGHYDLELKDINDVLIRKKK